MTTLGKDGVRITSKGGETLELPAAKDVVAHEPTGVGDAFRAGFLAAMTWQVGLERSAQVGCVLAAYVVETVGTAGVHLHRRAVPRARLEHSYGGEAADAVRPQHLVTRQRLSRLHQVARHAVLGQVLADVLLPRIRHQAGMS